MATLASHLAVTIVLVFTLSQACQAQTTGYVSSLFSLMIVLIMTYSMTTESATQAPVDHRATRPITVQRIRSTTLVGGQGVAGT